MLSIRGQGARESSARYCKTGTKLTNDDVHVVWLTLSMTISSINDTKIIGLPQRVNLAIMTQYSMSQTVPAIYTLQIRALLYCQNADVNQWQ